MKENRDKDRNHDADRDCNAVRSMKIAIILKNRDVVHLMEIVVRSMEIQPFRAVHVSPNER